MLNKKIELANKVTIPIIGFGTWQIPNGQVAYDAVRNALDVGYRHIDTAYTYDNERSVGKAIKDSNISRKDLFITSKLPSNIKNYDETIKYFNKTLTNLELDYLDLYLIHAPWPWNEIGKDCREGNVLAWQAMIYLYNKGLIRAIGVSNFVVEDIEYLYSETKFYPHVNQIVFNIEKNQDEMLAYGKKHNIVIEAYSPLGTGKILNNEVLVALANKYRVTPAQLAIKYTLDCKTVTLPKTVSKARMIENSNLDFKIDDLDLEKLKNLTI